MDQGHPRAEIVRMFGVSLASIKRYLKLRNKVHVFCTIDSSVENSEQELIKQLKELARQRDELNQDSPPISSWAYKKAQKVIKDKTIKNQVDSKTDSKTDNHKRF